MSGKDQNVSVRPNSHRYKAMQQASTNSQERDRIKPVISKNEVVSTKPSAAKRIASDFIRASGEEMLDYVIKDKMIPGVKNMILDILEMAFFDRSGVRRNRRDDYYDQPSYNYSSRYRGRTYSDDYRRSRNNERDRGGPSRDSRKVKDYTNIVIYERRGAEDVVNAMRNIIEDQGAASVADLWELVGETSEPIDNSWGWTRTGDIGVKTVSNGFLVDVASAKYLD